MADNDQPSTRRVSHRSAALACAAFACLIAIGLPARNATAETTARAAAARLIAAYPDHLDRQEGADLIWRDGTRMRIDDGRLQKSHAEWLETPDLDDMLTPPYPAGAPATAPPSNVDPGRARNRAFFDKMYGDCTKNGVATNLTDVVWLPKTAPTKLKVTTVNGVDKKLAAISAELDILGPEFRDFLTPPAGTYNCRPIAGTQRVSAHGHGIAIDIATKHSHYWLWQAGAKTGQPVWTNKIPMEIVRIFEKHGFIWGGRWYHYDTMHFEYRPELLP